ncbi:DUF1127 domain-containing protein [Sneathiella limimaris]|uniref:DUF1127 domain-containing protein n=1 Tax=Sneathiella limimaris TaxID=1964213 RepID=UPI0019D07891|nr:DUF1127 domain-containing protein [Sneathiella limimaris]
MTPYSSKIFLINSQPPVYVDSSLSNMFQTARDYFQARATMRQLNELTDRELTDIGITRADIPAVAKGEFHR